VAHRRRGASSLCRARLTQSGLASAHVLTVSIAGALWLLLFSASLLFVAELSFAQNTKVPRFKLAGLPKVGTHPLRIVAGDVNNDGKPDLATVDWVSSTVSVLLAKSDVGFRRRISYAVGRHPAGIVMSDIDNDGDRDLVSASVDRKGSIGVLLNRGSGRFVRSHTYSSGPRAYAVAAGDVDGDGHVDLVTANATRTNMVVLRGRGDGGFVHSAQYTGAAATDVELGDLNGDGTLDVVLATQVGGNSISVRLGTGSGLLGPEVILRSGSDPFDVTLADLNHDNVLDITVANYGGGDLSVLLGLGGGTFGERTRYSMGMGFNLDAVVVADFDRDGHVDIAAPELFNPFVRRGVGDGTFLKQQTVAPDSEGFGVQGGAVADFNADGWPDLAFSGTCDGPDCNVNWVHVYLNWTGAPKRPCVVPRIIGLPLRRARQRLSYSDCALGGVERHRATTGREGVVIRQSASDGSVLPNGSEVDVTVRRRTQSA
jgi:hypothetical protein